MTRRPVIILGMHRSGTSCLTGSLEEAGLWLGEVVREAPHNAKGNRENRAIMHLHDAVLADNDAAWDAPPGAGGASWRPERKKARDRLIAAYPADRVWGFKDPRTLFTLEGWLEALPDARLAGSFRHPMAVAQSLAARNGFSVDAGLGLWLTYNRRLLEIAARRDLPLICFDWPAERYDRALHAMTAQLGLTPPAQGFRFFETSLRHQAAPEAEELSKPVNAVYQALLEAAL